MSRRAWKLALIAKGIGRWRETRGQGWGRGQETLVSTICRIADELASSETGTTTAETATDELATSLVTGEIQMYVATQDDNVAAKPAAGDHGRTTGQTNGMGGGASEGLGAERCRHNQRLIIDGWPPEPGRSRKL
jgi:hypothetical protein